MVKALRFKGDKKVKKRKRAEVDNGNTEESSSSKVAKQQGSEEPEGWVDSESLEDINGPIILTFSAARPICIACDAVGKVFASPIDSAEGEDLSTAEPTDVKQVWVATKIHGTEKYSFKSHHGRYLSCDRFGGLGATREAISPEEEFLPVPNELGGGRWALQTVRDKFLSVDEVGAGGATEIRGDAEAVGFKETFVVRLQARNKKRKKSGTEGKGKDKITRKELEEQAGVKLDDEQVKALKRARREGRFHEALLDIRVKFGKHDKFAY
ncbi:FRG1-like family-domain-containing protein [Tuber indicum]|nr:FRG1-like family-domain-containing protein [Tuber indicum]